MTALNPGRWIALLMILLPIGAELWRERPAETRRTVRKLAAPSDAPRDHVQYWIVQHEGDALGRTTAIHERVVPASGESAFEVSELDLSGTLDATRLDDPQPAMSGRLIVATYFPPSRHERGIGPIERWVDLGDGRPFAVLQSGLELPEALLSITQHGPHATVMARTVALDDLGEEIPDRQVLPELEDHGEDPRSPPGLRAVGAGDPLYRLLGQTAPGAWVLYLGLLMLLGGSIWRRFALAAFVFCLGVSLVQRAHLQRELGRLESDDARTRVAAASRLATNPLYPTQVAEAFHAALSSESDPAVKAQLYRSLARSTRSCARHPELRSFLKTPEAAEDPAVRDARQQWQQSLSRAKELEQAQEDVQERRAGVRASPSGR